MENSVSKMRIGDYGVNSINPTPYAGNPCKMYKVDFKELSRVNSNGLRLIDYIVNNLSLTSSGLIELDQLEIERYLFGERTRASNAYVYRAIIALLEAGLISRAVTKNHYWFNYNVIIPVYS